MRSEPPTPPPVPQTYRIVVGVDYSEPGALALEAALVLALERDGMVYAVTVAEGLPPTRPAEESEDAAQAFEAEGRSTLEDYLAEHVARFESAGVRFNKKRIAATLDFGDPADCILNLARETDADLVIVGTHGRKGLDRLLVGSVATQVLRTATCPVLVMRGKAHES